MTTHPKLSLPPALARDIIFLRSTKTKKKIGTLYDKDNKTIHQFVRRFCSEIMNKKEISTHIRTYTNNNKKFIQAKSIEYPSLLPSLFVNKKKM